MLRGGGRKRRAGRNRNAKFSTALQRESKNPLGLSTPEYFDLTASGLSRQTTPASHMSKPRPCRGRLVLQQSSPRIGEPIAQLSPSLANNQSISLSSDTTQNLSHGAASSRRASHSRSASFLPSLHVSSLTLQTST